MSEIALRILLFEGVACCLLAAIFACRWFYRQPIDRIRLTQLGFGLIVVAGICIGCGIGPTVTLSRYSVSSVEPSVPSVVNFNTEYTELFTEFTEYTEESSKISTSFMPLCLGENEEEFSHKGTKDTEELSEISFIVAPLHLGENIDIAQERMGVSPPVLDVLVETHRGANAAPLLRSTSAAPLLSLVLLPPLFLFLRNGLARRRLDAKNRVRSAAQSPD